MSTNECAPQTTVAAFAAAVDRYGPEPALVHETGGTLSYAQLDAQRVEAARALLSSQIQPGDRVAIWAPNCVEWVSAALAIHSVGAILVPINTRMRALEVGYILEKSGARLLFSAGDFLARHFPTTLGTSRPSCVEEIIVLREARGTDVTWAQFLERAGETSVQTMQERAAAVSPDDYLDIMFTSGTTGAPKGVMTRHGQNLRMIRQWSERMEITSADNYLVANPFFHSFGYKVGWLAGLLKGATVLPHAVFDADAVMARIDRDAISVLPGPPTLFISLLEQAATAGHDLSSLRATITGAAAIAPSLIRRIRAELGFSIVLTGYGLTESCGTVSLCYPDDPAETIVNTVGKPLPGTEVRIVDTHSGQTLKAYETGEIVVRGYNVMAGFLDDAEATAKAIDEHGWLHTGDVGMLDDAGYIRITDRLKDMYIAGGFNCYPAEIENLMSDHPAISRVAVIGIPDDRLGEVGQAFVVTQSGHHVDEAELIAWCREHMANYKVPRSIRLVEALPTNASGKVLKHRLKQDDCHASA